MEDLLLQAGLNQAQVATYLYLLEHGQTLPPLIAKATRLTRSNAYKVLEQLDELGLVQKFEVDKKLAYQAADPTALASLVAEERNRVVALEQTVKNAMQQLRAKYRQSTGGSRVSTSSGQSAIIDAYEQQAEQKQPIYFIKSRADIPFLGFDTMDRLRRLPATHGTKRYGITPSGAEVPHDPIFDQNSNLSRTIIPAEDYTAPVEWAVTNDELLITIFEGIGRVIRIQDSVVASSFGQIWKLIDKVQNTRTSQTRRKP